MAFHHTVKVWIGFNEHDNEEAFIAFLKEKLKEIESWEKEDWHQDVFIERLDWGTLKEYEKESSNSSRP